MKSPPGRRTVTVEGGTVNRAVERNWFLVANTESSGWGRQGSETQPLRFAIS
jgi:hypothetical protein